jgi:hypothetical protein
MLPDDGRKRQEAPREGGADTLALKYGPPRALEASGLRDPSTQPRQEKDRRASKDVEGAPAEREPVREAVDQRSGAEADRRDAGEHTDPPATVLRRELLSDDHDSGHARRDQEAARRELAEHELESALARRGEERTEAHANDAQKHNTSAANPIRQG